MSELRDDLLGSHRRGGWAAFYRGGLRPRSAGRQDTSAVKGKRASQKGET
jgi:hypothetical protein